MNESAKVYRTYMELCLHMDGGPNLYLKVPTVWDHHNMQWIGFVKTPKTERLIHGEGEDRQKLEESFNRALKAFFDDPEMADEIFSMFKPLSYWDEMNVTE